MDLKARILALTFQLNLEQVSLASTSVSFVICRIGDGDIYLLVLLGLLKLPIN